MKFYDIIKIDTIHYIVVFYKMGYQYKIKKGEKILWDYLIKKN